MSAETPPKFNFEVGVYRPPSEGGSQSLLVRVTRKEPLALRLLVASLASKPFYPARGTLSPHKRVLPLSCLPRI